MTNDTAWPVIAGAFEVGDPQGPLAVCALTSDHLIAPLARLPGVAIAGKVYTANLGIARIVINVTANPSIRFLLLCGKDSVLFRPGQSLTALAEAGIDEQRQIVGAVGYEPVLPAPAAERVAQFRRQVEVIDWTGEESLATLEAGIAGLVARSPGRFDAGEESAGIASYSEQFTAIRPGGQREPLQYDPKGYFVISLDRAVEEIIVRHYLTDHTPAHEMRGRSAGPMLLGLLREELVTQLSHSGYLGEELAKAQAALHLGLRYDQDRPLRLRETPVEPGRDAPPNAPQAAPDQRAATAAATPQPPDVPRMAQISTPATWEQFRAAELGAQVDVVLAVTELPAPGILGGTFLEADEAEPFSAYRRTAHQLRVLWTPATQIAMGGPDDLHVGALVRVRGVLASDAQVDAQKLVILTHAARIVEG